MTQTPRTRVNGWSRPLLASLATALVASFVYLSSPPAAASEKVQSLRGVDVSAPETASEEFRREKDRAPIPRDFVQQPPLVPHSVQGYNVTVNFNKCMDCHSWNRYKETGATKVSLTHFKTRDGQELSNISPRRYFCLTCHVPQTDAKPLVANNFKPAQGIR